MTREMLLVLGALLVVLVLLYLRGLAGRLDRLHLRVDAASSALEARLVERAALARELALTGWLDPASAVLLLDAAAEAAAGAASGTGAGAESGTGESRMERDAAQSDLSAALRAVLDEPETLQVLEERADADDLLTDLARATQGVVLARRFANDAAQAVVAVRRRWLVRWLRLAGHAPWPISREMDDAPPASLSEFTLPAT